VVVGLTTDGQFDLDRPRSEEDWLSLVRKEDEYYPALTVTYIPSQETQWRFSSSETTVRPDLREVANTTFLDPLTLDPIRGTSGLRSTQIKHYVVRWEWYIENGDSLSVGMFYKDMIDPIESIQSPAQDGPPLIVKANAETGELLGLEVEFMKDLKFISEWGAGDFWQNMFASGNFTLSDSEIVIDRQKTFEQTGLSSAITNDVRRLTGHSEWVYNMQLGYDSIDGNHTATVAYNVFGPRIITPGIEDWDDSYEQPFHSLDLIYSYFPSYSSQIKFKIQNLLDQKRKIEITDTMNPEFGDILDYQTTKGIGFSVSYSAEF
jgi:outer membrane receptor protein involved in Fe transport